MNLGCTRSLRAQLALLQGYDEFWPAQGSAPIEHSSFTVTPITDSQLSDGTSSHDFLLQSTQDDYECTTRLLVPGLRWPDDCAPLVTAFDLIAHAKKWQRQNPVDGPVVVVDE